MFLKRRTRTKDGQTHAYHSDCESLHVRRDRVVQRQVFHPGEINWEAAKLTRIRNAVIALGEPVKT